MTIPQDIKLMVAIVDDRVDDHYLIERALKEYPNISYKSFYDGPQLINYLLKTAPAQKDSPLPDIVLIDVNMPTLSGYDTIKKLKEHSEIASKIYFIIFSNSSEFDFLRHQDLGVDCYSKPPTFDKLKELLEKIISDYLAKGYRNS